MQNCPGQVRSVFPVSTNNRYKLHFDWMIKWKQYQSPLGTPDRSSFRALSKTSQNFVMWNGHRPMVPCALPRLRTRWFQLHIHSLILVLASQRKGRFLRRPHRQPRVVDLLTCGYCGIVFIPIRWRPSSLQCFGFGMCACYACAHRLVCFDCVCVNSDSLVEMLEPCGQLRKEHLTFPGCSHFRRLDDNHEKCQSCMYGGAPGCTRLSRCHFCADWTSSSGMLRGEVGRQP